MDTSLVSPIDTPNGQSDMNNYVLCERELDGVKFEIVLHADSDEILNEFEILAYVSETIQYSKTFKRRYHYNKMSFDDFHKQMQQILIEDKFKIEFYDTNKQIIILKTHEMPGAPICDLYGTYMTTYILLNEHIKYLNLKRENEELKKIVHKLVLELQPRLRQ
jgi:hypothetical protein